MSAAWNKMQDVSVPFAEVEIKCHTNGLLRCTEQTQQIVIKDAKIYFLLKYKQ